MFMKLLHFIIILFTHYTLFAQVKLNTLALKDKMQWFVDAKLGIFIHAASML